MSGKETILAKITDKSKVDAIETAIGRVSDHVRNNLVGGEVVKCGKNGAVCVETKVHYNKGHPAHRDSLTVSPKDGVARTSVLTDRGVKDAVNYDGEVQYFSYKYDTKDIAKKFVTALKCGHPLTADMEKIRESLGLKPCKK